MEYEVEFVILKNLLVELIESQSGRNIDLGQEWLNDAQVLSIKLFRHLASMQKVANGATMGARNNLAAPYIDHASVKVIARAALETYLVFSYIYGADERTVSLFRHNTWHLGGLIDRQKYSVIGGEARKVAAQEAEIIERLKAVIEQSPHFLEYSQKQRLELLAGYWRVGSGWSDLAIQAGFHEGYFRNIYNYLCGYSHSSYASALQIGQAQSFEDQKMLTRATISIGVVIMAHFAFTYPCIFADAGDVLATNPEGRTIAEKWRFGREDMAHLFGE